MKLTANERYKLIATAFNTLATFTFGAAVLTPIIAMFWGLTNLLRRFRRHPKLP